MVDAARRLDPADVEAQIFLEEREDVRARAVGTEPGRLVRTRQTGVTVRCTLPQRRAVHRHDPSREDLAALAETTSPRRASLDASETGERPTTGGGGRFDAALSACRRVVEVAGSHALAGESIEARALFVGLDQTVRIARPDRPLAKDRRTGYRLRLDVVVRARGGVGTASGDLVVGPGGPVDLLEFPATVVLRARERIRPDAPPMGTMPAVFAPGVGGILVHELVGHALEADTVLRGGSLLAAHSGRVASEGVRVLDDPRRGRVAWRIDDEGEAARPTPLIEAGHVVGRIHDLETAITCGETPTGHGRCAGFQEEVLPRLGCTFLAPGRDRPADLVADVGRGIYVRRLEAASVRPDVGLATFVVSDADLIERGRIVAPLRPFVMGVASLRALAALDGIGDDLEFDRCIGSCLREGQPMVTTVGAPTFRIGLIRVTS